MRHQMDYSDVVFIILLASFGCSSQTPRQSTGDSQSSADARKSEHNADLSASDSSPSVYENWIEPVSALNIANPPRIELLIPTKEFMTNPETGALLVTFADLNLLTVLNMKHVTNDAVQWMPTWLKALDGKQVRIRGYMYPTFLEKEIERFVLVNSDYATNFGAPIRADEAFLVNTKPGKRTDYVPMTHKVDVGGEFKIDLESQEGMIIKLYEINNAAVARVP